MDDLFYLDLDGDGVLDTQSFYDEMGGITYLSDLNGDGNVDIEQHLTGCDIFGNPTHQEVAIDTDNNGLYDTFTTSEADEYGNLVAFSESNDYNQDGVIDMERMLMDTNGDGILDTSVVTHMDNTDNQVVSTTEINTDLTGDHSADLSGKIVTLDTTGDGVPDMVELYYADANGNFGEPETMSYDEYLTLNELDYSTGSDIPAPFGQFDPNTDSDLVIGDPSADMENWEFQGNTGRCAIYAQKFAIEQITGQEIPIEELVSVAEENGWFDESKGGGTTSLNMTKLLDYYNVDNDLSFDNDISDLEKALNDGNKVIVSIDSDQVWSDAPNDIFVPEYSSDHAVEVIGIDKSDPDQPMVVLNDSGHPNGCGELVPLDVFENSWEAGDSQMIVCYA